MNQLSAINKNNVSDTKYYLFKPIWALLQRDVTVMLRGSAAMASLGFFLLTGCIAPLALGAEPFLLIGIAPGFIWVLAVLASLIGLETLFQEELQDGSLGSLRLTPLPLAFIALTKTIAYWLTVCLPLSVAAPIIVFLLGGDDTMAILMFISLVVGSPALVLIGGTLAAICASLRRGTGLVMFLALPFFSPALIFGTRVLNEGSYNQSALLFLAAFTFQAIAICPFIMAAALRHHME